MWKRRICVLFLSVICFWWSMHIPLQAEGLESMEPQDENPDAVSFEIQAEYGILMEASTGKVLFEKAADSAAAPASVTKIMTMLLIFEALENGKIALQDEVTVSEYAASMGGSQVFLEPNEVQTVDTMLKCIAIASANDACVAMAEHINGSAEAFVKKMNEKAEELGMKNTVFKNCNGLDTEGHKMSARDVALMSRELIVKYPEIRRYCTVWMESITHHTSKGSSEFGLSNTNKLIRQYEHCTGLKTGSTEEAGFCFSATAEKDGMELIAVVMKGETSKSRFADAKSMLNYGFSNYRIYRDTEKGRMQLPKVQVISGRKESTLPIYKGEFFCLLQGNLKSSDIDKKLELETEIKAPIKKGQKLGKLVYFYGEEKLGETEIVASETIEEAKYLDELKKVWLAWLM